MQSPSHAWCDQECAWVDLAALSYRDTTGTRAASPSWNGDGAKRGACTGGLLEVFVVEMLSGRILRRAGNGMLLLLSALDSADPETLGLCGAVVPG